ncbi:MAG: hypothetical protein SNH55_02135 [Rikenellaceae bacterium]
MAYKIIAYIELLVIFIVGISIFTKSPTKLTWQEVQELIDNKKVDVIARRGDWQKEENLLNVYIKGQRKEYHNVEDRIPKYYFSIDSEEEYNEIRRYVNSQKSNSRPYLSSDYTYKTSFTRFLKAMFWIIFGFAFIYTIALGVKIENGYPVPNFITLLSGGVLIGVVIAVLIAIISLIVWLASFGAAGLVGGLFLFVMVCLYSMLLFGK